MKRIALLAPVAAAGLGVALAIPTMSSASPMTTFTLVVEDAQGTLTPAPDEFFGAAVQNAQASEDAPVSRDGTAVGLAETVITITRVDGDDVAAMIECSIELPEGVLLFNGSAHFADLASGVILPVVGGTGDYAGARGTVVMTASADQSQTTLDFDITTS